jgi:hypothetical protein
MSNGERRLVIPRHDPINAITMGACPVSIRLKGGVNLVDR